MYDSQINNATEEEDMDTTKKYARTMEEAFGPYARGQLQEEYTPMTRIDRIIVILSAVIISAVLIGVVVGII